MSILSIEAPARRGAGPDRVGDPAPRRDDRPPLRLVEPEAPRRRLRVGVVGTTLLVALCAGIFGLAAVHTLVVQAQFELDRLDQQVADRQGELDSLRLEVAGLESPEAITEAARDLGLVTPSERVYLDPVQTPVPERGPGAERGPPPPGEEQAARSVAGGR
ncbi:MAG: septum formation initiator family protein [Acidimicrobiales bacterium]|nr:septum formation initiator family protein [Acidimicrobiales bacterium]